MENSKGVSLLSRVTLLFMIWIVQTVLTPVFDRSLVPLTAPAAAVAAGRPFYEGKTIKVIIPVPPGGGYDRNTRLLTGHMGKHIPGRPRFILEYMDGAGGLVAANYVYNRVKPDGLTFMFFNPIFIVSQLVGSPHVLLDVRKMGWIGCIGGSPNVCIVRKDARYQKIEEMIGAKEPLLLGATPSSSREYYPRFMSEIMGTNLKIITGYKNAGAIWVAIETHELEGTCGIGYDSLQVERGHWLQDKFVSIFMQLNPVEKIPGLPNVPWIMDYVKKPADRQMIEAGMGVQAIVRSFVAPPGMPKERLDILRTAFMDTMKDPEFLAEAAKIKSDVRPLSGAQVQKLIGNWFDTPRESIDKIRKIYFPAGF